MQRKNVKKSVEKKIKCIFWCRSWIRTCDLIKVREFVDRSISYRTAATIKQYLLNYIGTAAPEVVSSDFVGNRHALIVDGEATIVDANRCILYCWYDNEFGYSCQVVRCLEEMAGVRWAMYPRAAV